MWRREARSLEVADAEGVALEGTATGIHGVITDSIGEPVSGATVWIAGTNRRTRSAEDGTFTLADLTEGKWSLRASHAALESFGYAGTATEIEVQRDRLRPVQLSLPSRRAVLAGRCPVAADPDEPAGLLAGRVVDASRAPVPHAKVRSTWERGKRFEGAITDADSLGVFALCGLPTGRRMRGIRIVAHPGGRTVETDGSGTFDFGSLPPAIYTLEFRLPGQGTWQQRVEVRAYSETFTVLEVEQRGPEPPPRR